MSSKALVLAAVIGSIAVNIVMMAIGKFIRAIPPRSTYKLSYITVVPLPGTALPTVVVAAVVPSMQGAAVVAEAMAPAAEAPGHRMPSSHSHIITVAAAAASTTRASSFWPCSI